MNAIYRRKTIRKQLTGICRDDWLPVHKQKITIKKNTTIYMPNSDCSDQ